MQMYPDFLTTEPLLTDEQAAALRVALAGRTVVCNYGAGVDSLAMILALRCAGITPDLLLFANFDNEKKATYTHLAKVRQMLAIWGWPTVTEVRYRPGPKTPYTDLLGNCLSNWTMPSLAFGKKGCSAKWKGKPLDDFLLGLSKGPNKRPPHPLWLRSQASGSKIVKLIGYDASAADRERAGRIEVDEDGPFEYCYPLQLLGWRRRDCLDAIVRLLGLDMVPVKSACFFCPGMKPWEIFHAAYDDPDQLDLALHMEANAMLGKNSRYRADDFGGTWLELIDSPVLVVSSKAKTQGASVLGLGREFAWNQFCRIHQILDEHGKVRRGDADRARFLEMAMRLRTDDNALDARCGIDFGTVPARQRRRVIPIARQQSLDLDAATSSEGGCARA